MNKKAFSLIELLIVIAIVSILAAIAVPNFLTAQIRSKIAHVKNALKTGALGLEAYYVDYNDYPFMREWRGPTGIGLLKRRDCFEYPYEITTPVAYLSKRPIDVFNVFEGGGGSGTFNLVIKYSHAGPGYFNGELAELGIWVPRAFPHDEGSNATDILYKGNIETDIQKPAYASPVKYALWSTSPNDASWKFFGDHKPIPLRMRYDPTNGITSLGFIVRLSNPDIGSY